ICSRLKLRSIPRIMPFGVSLRQRLSSSCFCAICASDSICDGLSLPTTTRLTYLTWLRSDIACLLHGRVHPDGDRRDGGGRRSLHRSPAFRSRDRDQVTGTGALIFRGAAAVCRMSSTRASPSGMPVSCARTSTWYLAELSELRVFSLWVATEPWMFTLAEKMPHPTLISAFIVALASVDSLALKEDFTSMSNVMSTLWMLSEGTLTIDSSGTSSSTSSSAMAPPLAGSGLSTGRLNRNSAVRVPPTAYGSFGSGLAGGRKPTTRMKSAVALASLICESQAAVSGPPIRSPIGNPLN